MKQSYAYIRTKDFFFLQKEKKRKRINGDTISILMSDTNFNTDRKIRMYVDVATNSQLSEQVHFPKLSNQSWDPEAELLE